MKTIGILGTGSWAIGLASVLLDNGHKVIMWGRDEKQTLALEKTGKNPKYSLHCTLKGNISFTNDFFDLSELDYLLNAIPTQATRSVLKALTANKNLVKKETVIINVSKGIEKESLNFISEICSELLPNNSYAVLSGPSHAEEVARRLPTTIVAASENPLVAEEVQQLFFSKNLRVYTNPDVKGVELSAALKNVIAISAGISDGLGFGDNTKAALMTRGMAEIKRLGKSIGAKDSTFNGLAGIGDLIVTCTSMHSRNRRFGIMIGEGLSAEEASKRIGMVIEGAHTVKAAKGLSEKLGVEMPLTNVLYEILYKGLSPLTAVETLMGRDMKSE